MLADEDETTKEREGIEGQPEEEDIVPEISLHAIMGTGNAANHESQAVNRAGRASPSC